MDQQTLEAQPAFLHGPKQLFIDGQWVDAISGETFASINPSNGREIGRLALGAAADTPR
jgi:acyl-CoA reductase-like NAD-dependent aldehyde dehydrogenase